MMVTKPLRQLSRNLLIAVVAIGTIAASTVTLVDRAGAAAPTSGPSRAGAHV